MVLFWSFGFHFELGIFFREKKQAKIRFHINVVRCMRCNAVGLNECAFEQSCLSTSLLNNHLCIAVSLTRGRMHDIYLPGVWGHTSHILGKYLFVILIWFPHRNRRFRKNRQPDSKIGLLTRETGDLYLLNLTLYCCSCIS